MARSDLDSGIDLEQLGLPISNTENKLLEAEIQKKEKESLLHQIKIDEHHDRIQAIKDHLKNVKQELQHTAGLLEARKKDAETEEHMQQLADREEGRLKGDLRTMGLEREDVKEKMNIYENNIYRAKQEAEDLKSQMNWDQQALEVWLEESARQDEDAITIAKYARADETKIKDLSLKIENLHDQMEKKKKQLDDEMMKTITAQIEVDKTAEDFRVAHQEREGLIRQWEHTIEQMKKRDQGMDKCANELAQLKVVIKEMEYALKEKQEFLNSEKENNEEMEKKLQESERLVAKKRMEYQDAEMARVQVKDELETLKHGVDKMAADLESARGQSTQLGKDIKDKRKKLETLIKQRELMQLELKKVTQKTLSSEEHAHQIDRLLAEEESKIARLEKEADQLKEKHFLHAQKLFELKRKENTMQAETQGGKAALRNLGAKQHKLDEELLKQQEILYTQDFGLQQLQHRLNRMEGERTGEEMEILNEKLKELDQDWMRQHGEEQLIRSQLKRVQEDLRRVNRDIEKSLKKKLAQEDKINEINLHIDTTQRELKKVIAIKQDKMVDENIIKLQVKRLRDHLYAHADDVHSLGKRKLQLDTAMSERMREIAVHKDMLKAQIKACDSERMTISAELHERISKIDKLRNRYEIVTVAMNPPEGEEQHSQAYYVIKAAQEREELQRRGDELDAKIKKAEKEIRAMENTLLLMNSKNTSFRKSLSKVDKSADEVEQLKTLEGQRRATQDRVKQKRTNVRQIQDDMKVMERTLSSLNADEAKISSDLEAKQNTLALLMKESDDLKAKHERVSLQTAKMVKELGAKEEVCGINPSHVQKDIELRVLRDFGADIVQQLGTLASHSHEVVPTLQLLFSQAGLPPPPSPSGSRASSVLSSARSSVSSVSGRGGFPFQTNRVDIGSTSRGSTASTPKAGASPCSSTSSLVHSKVPMSRSKTSSKQSSQAPSKASSRASSVASSGKSKGSKKKDDLDLTIGPSSSTSSHQH